MMLHFLASKNWLREDETGKALYVVADNCAGQNKNSTVIRLMLYLVENNYFETACITFLVRGHTKNACDRMFNLMKMNFHKRDLFTYEDVLETLGMTDQVNIIDFPAEEFRDWGRYFDKFYSKMVPGTVADNHVFLVKRDQPTTMVIQQYMGSDEELNPKDRDFMKKGTDGTRRMKKNEE